METKTTDIRAELMILLFSNYIRDNSKMPKIEGKPFFRTVPGAIRETYSIILKEDFTIDIESSMIRIKAFLEEANELFKEQMSYGK